MNNDVELIPVKGVLPSVQVQLDNVIYVPQAHKNKAGIVKEGDGVLIENGVVSLNKQTVEDMIDANKWVSYGFQQNLTEDEKGMARHNIGAGDNYFTGSYYDLTQKPHLNTNNTAGLDYGDEELNDTINLHKISKTGSFNDLKHVPQETLDFAESERQKSKNLFKVNNVAGYSITKNGVTATINDDYTITLNGTCTANSWYNLFNGISTGSTFVDTYPKLYLDSNKTYSYILKKLSGSYSSTTSDSQLVVSFRQTDGTGIVTGKHADLGIKGNNDISSVTKTGIDYLNNGFFRTTSGLTYTNYTFGLMICEGEDTDFQSWNGKTLHEKDISDVEHIETIYDMKSSDSNINKGYTAGKQFDNNATGMPIDLGNYKKLRLCFKLYNQTIVYFDFGIPNNTYFTMCAVCMEPTYSVTIPIMLSVYYSNGNLKCYKAVLGIGGEGGNLNNSDNAVLIKVQGVK